MVSVEPLNFSRPLFLYLQRKDDNNSERIIEEVKPGGLDTNLVWSAAPDCKVKSSPRMYTIQNTSGINHRGRVLSTFIFSLRSLAVPSVPRGPADHVFSLQQPV